VEEKMGRKEKAQQHFTRADSLSGYPPKKEAQPIAETKPSSQEKSKSQASQKPKLTSSHFVSIVKGIFTDRVIRKEFTAFLTGIFVKKSTKNS
jgi:hypothetical protein